MSLLLRLGWSPGRGTRTPGASPLPSGRVSAVKNERTGHVIFLCKAKKKKKSTHSHLPLSREGLGSPSGLPTLNSASDEMRGEVITIKKIIIKKSLR